MLPEISLSTVDGRSLDLNGTVDNTPSFPKIDATNEFGRSQNSHADSRSCTRPPNESDPDSSDRSALQELEIPIGAQCEDAVNEAKVASRGSLLEIPFSKSSAEKLSRN